MLALQGISALSRAISPMAANSFRSAGNFATLAFHDPSTFTQPGGACSPQPRFRRIGASTDFIEPPATSANPDQAAAGPPFAASIRVYCKQPNAGGDARQPYFAEAVAPRHFDSSFSRRVCPSTGSARMVRTAAKSDAARIAPKAQVWEAGTRSPAKSIDRS